MSKLPRLDLASPFQTPFTVVESFRWRRSTVCWIKCVADQSVCRMEPTTPRHFPSRVQLHRILKDRRQPPLSVHLCRPPDAQCGNQIIKTEDVSDSGVDEGQHHHATASFNSGRDRELSLHSKSSRCLPPTASPILPGAPEKAMMQYGGIHIYDGYTSRGCSHRPQRSALGTPYNGATATAVADGSGWIISNNVHGCWHLCSKMPVASPFKTCRASYRHRHGNNLCKAV